MGRARLQALVPFDRLEPLLSALSLVRETVQLEQRVAVAGPLARCRILPLQFLC